MLSRNGKRLFQPVAAAGCWYAADIVSFFRRETLMAVSIVCMDPGRTKLLKKRVVEVEFGTERI